ncbi:Methionyl-tRNA formyltransferase [Saxophila tyrrhenica]|uniref:methionyl-tRNA formyltransferase n=1 Tax=Saxophila tyrrhenica TaxID=1690608 RepID=A0AAV9NYP3_9PEZI|nr:Methionyl-tRNA formyltransferase [Saxophila tyrrhenica]
MLQPVRRVVLVGRSHVKGVQWNGYRAYTAGSPRRQREPLNILFCGADEFSIYSLRALRELQNRQPEKISSIDVVCRPDKRTGRGLKQVRQVPIKPVASELGLTLHQIDSFKAWSPPTPINLVVAVSFGLLVPARILTGAKHGGLNVHPSLLPDLRGPAPIVHTLLQRRSHTGVTVQTMHPTKFDHGTIVAQTPAPGIQVAPQSTPQDLLDVLGPMGAETLSQTIERGSFVSPEQTMNSSTTHDHLEHAPKITPQDRRIDWVSWSADDIILRDRILGRLWDPELYMRCNKNTEDGMPKRITLSGPWRVWTPEEINASVISNKGPGDPLRLYEPERPRDNVLGIVTCDRKVVCPASATIEGQKKDTGLQALLARVESVSTAPHKT